MQRSTFSKVLHYLTRLSSIWRNSSVPLRIRMTPLTTNKRMRPSCIQDDVALMLDTLWTRYRLHACYEISSDDMHIRYMTDDIKAETSIHSSNLQSANEKTCLLSTSRVKVSDQAEPRRYSCNGTRKTNVPYRAPPYSIGACATGCCSTGCCP